MKKFIYKILDPSLSLALALLIGTYLMTAFFVHNPGTDGRPDTFDEMCSAYTC